MTVCGKRLRNAFGKGDAGSTVAWNKHALWLLREAKKALDRRVPQTTPSLLSQAHAATRAPRYMDLPGLSAKQSVAAHLLRSWLAGPLTITVVWKTFDAGFLGGATQ